MTSPSFAPRRWLYRTLGALAVGLALLGVALPLLPTTPFLLVAAWCFARSSPRWHRWLLNHRLLGPFLRDWEERRCVTRNVKRFAVCSVILFAGSAVLFAFDHWGGKLFGLVVIAVSLTILWRLPVCPEQEP